MRTEVILRTHDGSDVHPEDVRIVSEGKKEIVKRCFNSLVTTITESNADHTLTIIDDHSSEETLGFLRSHGDVTQLSETGNNASWYTTFSRASKSRADVVYLVEDDYLHAPEALREMLFFYEYAHHESGREIVLCPYDDYFNYNRGPDTTAFVMTGRERHWRTNTYTMGTFLIAPSLVRTHFAHFERLAQLYETEQGKVEGVTEETTIGNVWNRGHALLFTPLPSLAVHLNHNEPPLFDWRTLWEKYA